MRRALLLSIAATATVLGGFFWLSRQPQPQSSPQPAAAGTAEIFNGAAAPANGAYSVNNTAVSLAPATAAMGFGFDTIEVIVSRNDTLDRIFRKLQLNIADLATIRELPGIRQTLDFLKPGDALTVTHHEGELQGLVRRINDVQTLKVTRDASGFLAEIMENPLETQVTRKRGRITSSLFEAANTAGISDQTATQLASIFGWDIDFVLDIREGDEFTVVFEGLWQDGQYLRDGNILAAEFVNNGRTFRAVRYQDQGGRAEYFTPDGRSMHKAFLRAPLEFTRISSRFNPRRRHPVLNTIRAHKGVDYAAPTGTPVRAAGNGRVQLRGRHGGYGNAVVLEHGGGVTTLYGHLSRFTKGIREGQRVNQGQVIGYVGQTGLASGPHLHYEYRVYGTHRNPQTVPLPEAKPIAPELLADFRTRTAPLLAILDPAHNGQMLASQ